MRIIGEIPHPIMKISVFQSDQKISIKFEYQLMEQIYKFRDGEGISNFQDAEKNVTEEICEKVMEIFKHQVQLKSIFSAKGTKQTAEIFPDLF